MRVIQSRSIRFVQVAGVSAGLLFCGSLWGGDDPVSPDPGLLSELTAYYDASPSEVIERLAREAEARRIYKPIRDFLGESYAGAWFDDETLELAVALTDSEHAGIVRRLGARPVFVEHGLAQLKELIDHIGQAAAADRQLKAAAIGWHVDYPTNQVVVEVLPTGIDYARARVEQITGEPSDRVRFEIASNVPTISSKIRGANCYLNDANDFRCSIGFSVVGGYITAGHCGEVDDAISTCDGATAMGSFEGTTWPNDHDSGWVETNASWTPVHEVNGYDDGILDIPAASGGFAEAPLYSTVCRYGQQTKGPKCGQIVAKNKEQDFCVEKDIFGRCTASVTMKDVTETEACEEGGDSGGPFISGDGQAQGTLIGGEADYGCSKEEKDNDRSFFEPAIGTLDVFGLTLLSAHGSNPPDITSFVCPNADSGQGTYFCEMTYDTQGPTPIDWTTNTGDSGDGEVLIGDCLDGQTVHVDLLVTNNYGSDSRSASFACPTNDLQ